MLKSTPTVNLEDYKPPAFPVEFPKFTEKVKFGNEIRQKHFYLEKEWIYMNHGKFGAALKEALDAEMAWLVHCERQSVRFFDREFFPHLVHVIRRIAKFIDADRCDVVLLPNATVAINTVVQSVLRTLKAGDSILILSLAYGTVSKLLQRIGRETDVRVDLIDVSFPITSQDSIVKLVEDSIKPDTKFAILDHVTSAHGLLLPIEAMVKSCHKRGVQVLVDGAHCFGSLPLSMRDIGADYYVANGHKWFLSPKGCAFLYVDKARHDTVRPLALSWGDGFGLTAEFGWIGTSDCTPYLCMNTVLDFWEFYGADNIRAYINATAKSASEMLVKEWNTELLADPSFFRSMVMVRLPEGLIPPEPEGPKLEMVDGKPKYDNSHCSYVGDVLYHTYKVEISLKCVAGKLYVRLAAHVYNEMKDFQLLAEAVNDMRKKNLEK